MSTNVIEPIADRDESDRRYAITLLMHIDLCGAHTSEYLKGNWCDSVIDSLLHDGYVEIQETVYSGDIQPGDPKVGYFYVSTEERKDRIKYIVKKAFEECSSV